MHGTNNENGYYIDGMNVSSTQSSGSIATFYLDPYAFEEANFRAGNAPAEATTGGLVFNMISRTGTNKVHGGSNFAGTNNHLAFDNVSGTLRQQLLRNVVAGLQPDQYHRHRARQAQGAQHVDAVTAPLQTLVEEARQQHDRQDA